MGGFALMGKAFFNLKERYDTMNTFDKEEKNALNSFIKALNEKQEEEKEKEALNSDQEEKEKEEKEAEKEQNQKTKNSDSEEKEEKKETENESEDKEEDKKEENKKTSNSDFYTQIQNAVQASIAKDEEAKRKAYNAASSVLGNFNPFGLSVKEIYTRALNHAGVALSGSETIGEMEAMLKVASSIKVDNSFAYSDASDEEKEIIETYI